MLNNVEWHGGEPLSKADPDLALVLHVDAKTSFNLPHKRADSVPGIARFQVDCYGFCDVTTDSALLFLMDYESSKGKDNSLLCSLLLETLRLRLCGRRHLFLCLDNGGGNKCGVLASFLTVLINARVLESATIGWYYPHHGKGPVDRFFGGAQSAYLAAEAIWSTDDLARLISSLPRCAARVHAWQGRYDVKKYEAVRCSAGMLIAFSRTADLCMTVDSSPRFLPPHGCTHNTSGNSGASSRTSHTFVRFPPPSTS